MYTLESIHFFFLVKYKKLRDNEELIEKIFSLKFNMFLIWASVLYYFYVELRHEYFQPRGPSNVTRTESYFFRYFIILVYDFVDMFSCKRCFFSRFHYFYFIVIFFFFLFSAYPF